MSTTARRTAANKLPRAFPLGSSSLPARLKAPGSRVVDEDIDELAEGLLRGQGATELPERGPRGPLAEARRVLSLANAPTELPCRDGEKAKVVKFMEDIMTKGERRPPSQPGRSLGDGGSVRT